MRTTASSGMRPKEISPGFQGLTLLELVVSTALVVVLGGAIAVFLSRGLVAVKQADNHLQQIFVIEKWFNSFGRELRNGVAVSDSLWEADQRHMTFVTAEEPTRLAVVSYRILSEGGTQTLIREGKKFPPENESGSVSTVATGVLNFSLEYGAVKEENGQRVFTWLQGWDATRQHQQLPKLVRVTIQTRTSGGQVYSSAREFLVPQGALGAVSGG